METIVVTGIRGSLQRSLDIKREAPGIVDAISMEDIGKFPDSNLAAALMRIPGVTVTRAALPNGGAVTTGQPTQITVRGFGPAFNETLFEGRRIPSGIGGRSFDFSGLSADMVSALEVYKSPDATLSAGAIGATVNVKYPKPFDKPGLTVSAAASASYAADDGRFTPNANFLVSNTFADGKFGVLLAGAHSELATTQSQYRNWGWIGQYIDPCQRTGGPACATDPVTGRDVLTRDNTKPVWWTQDYAIYHDQTREEKTNLRAAVQFQPNDALVITLDSNYARDSIHNNEWVYAIWNNVDEMRNVTTSKYGTITSYQRRAPSDFDANVNLSVQQTYDVGINLKYDVNSHFTLIADFDQALSALNPDDHVSSYQMDVGYGASQAGGINSMTVGVVQPGGHKLPYYTGIGPNGDASQFLNTNIMGSHVMVATAQRNRNLVNQAKIEGQWKEEGLNVKFGANYVTDHYKINAYDDFTNNRWQIYSGYGPDSNNYFQSGPNAGQPAGVHIPAKFFTGTIKLHSIEGWDTVNMIPGLPKFDTKAVYDYINSLGVATAATGPGSIPGFNWTCCLTNGATTYTGTDPNRMISLNPNGFQRIYEDSYSFYVSANTEAKIGGMPLKINAGVRYEYTSVEASGIGRPLTSMEIMSSDHTAYNFVYGASSELKERNSYQYLLPNLDLVLVAADDLQLRFDASRTLTRPPLANMNPNTQYGGRTGSLTANGGNPGLLPYLSDNVDVAAEWFYGLNSYLSANVYLKSVSNFVVNGTVSRVLQNVIDPYTNQPANFRLTSTVNGPKANVYGLELAWQHMFGDSGFGYQVNGTIVQSDKNYNPADLTTSAFAVPGLADSFNAVLFYDKDGFEVRLAANWRDTYLNNFGQSQNGTSFGIEPTYVNTAWSLDGSTSYDITENMNAYFEVTNILNQAFSSRGRYPDQILDVISYGRRFTAGVHYKL